jgi:hypothetical protein
MSDAVRKAVRDALAAYLRTELATAHPDLVVFDSWPDPATSLPAEAVSVLATGTIEEGGYAPQTHRVTPTAGVMGDVLYGFGTLTLGLQLDCWTHHEATRDVLARDLEAALNRPPAITLGLTGGIPQLGRERGLVIRIPNLFNCPADFRFEPTASPVENGDAAQTGEWRATWAGSAFVHLVNQESLALRQTLNLTGDVTKTVTP